MADAERSPETIQFHYIKSNLFRVVLADGAIGAITPQGRLAFSLYNERVSLPRLMVHQISEGALSQPIETETRGGIVREVECTVVMDRSAVQSLRDWLSTKLEEFDKLTATTASKNNAP